MSVDPLMNSTVNVHIINDSTINNELLMVVNVNVYIIDVYEFESRNNNSNKAM